jgi:hypothetical protein
MTVLKPLPIAAAVAGILAAIGISVKLATATNPLELRVDELITRISAPQEPTSESLKADIDGLTEVVNDGGFAKLPAAKQAWVQIHLAGLKVLNEYLDYDKELRNLPNLNSVRSAGELSQILKRARQIPVPYGSTNSVVLSTRYEILAASVRRGQTYLEEGQALLSAAESVQKDYEKVIDAGKLVLQQKNEPSLPDRIREVVRLAENLKKPQKDNDKPLPGASRLTYATVFQMSEIENLMREWDKLKQLLEPALKRATDKDG